MSALFVVLPVALVVATSFVVAFIWSVRGGQLDDLDTPALRVLHDDIQGARKSPDSDAPSDR